MFVRISYFIVSNSTTPQTTFAQRFARENASFNPNCNILFQVRDIHFTQNK
jgi:hypothetical protein